MAYFWIKKKESSHFPVLNRSWDDSFLGLFFHHLKADLNFKQISVNENFKGSALKSCQTLSDRETKSASLGGSGYITPDKAFGQFGALYI